MLDRGKGYFKQLANSLFDNLKDNNFIGIFGFANHNSHYGFRKYLNWQDLSILNLFQVKPNQFRNIKIIDNGIKLSYEDLTDELITAISNLKVVNSNKIHIKRDSKNIEWRLKNNPSNVYKTQVGRLNNQIVSILLYKKYKNEIDILEFFFSNIDNSELLNYHISNLITKFNSTINLWSNLHSLEHINLEKQGFQETNFNTYFGVIPFIDNPKLVEYKNWHYRFIDSDIF